MSSLPLSLESQVLGLFQVEAVEAKGAPPGDITVILVILTMGLSGLATEEEAVEAPAVVNQEQVVPPLLRFQEVLANIPINIMGH